MKRFCLNVAMTGSTHKEVVPSTAQTHSKNGKPPLSLNPSTASHQFPKTLSGDGGSGGGGVAILHFHHSGGEQFQWLKFKTVSSEFKASRKWARLNEAISTQKESERWGKGKRLLRNLLGYIRKVTWRKAWSNARADCWEIAPSAPNSWCKVVTLHHQY